MPVGGSSCFTALDSTATQRREGPRGENRPVLRNLKSSALNIPVLKAIVLLSAYLASYTRFLNLVVAVLFEVKVAVAIQASEQRISAIVHRQLSQPAMPSCRDPAHELILRYPLDRHLYDR